MAPVVKGHLPLELRTDIGHAENIHKEAGELVSLGGQLPSLEFIGLSLEEIGIKDLHHCDARARRTDHHFGIAKGLHCDPGR